MISEEDKGSVDEQVAEIYSERAEAYQRDAEHHFAPFARRLVELAGLRQGDAVLDISCGTGLVTFEAARVVGGSGSVLGLDLSAGQLAVAERTRAALGMTHVAFTRQNASDFAFDGKFDAILSSLGLPLRHDDCLRAARRALKPGGTLGICVWADDGQPFTSAFRRMLEARRTSTPNRSLETKRTVRALLMPQFSELGTPSKLEATLRRAGFADVVVRSEALPDHYESWREALALFRSWGIVDAELNAMDRDTFESLEREFAGFFGTMPRTEGAQVLVAIAVVPERQTV